MTGRDTGIFRLDRERCAAAAGGAGVGIVDPEGRGQQILGIVDLRAAEQFQRHVVNHEFDAMEFEDPIVLCGFTVQTEAIGKARATAARDTETQHQAVITIFGDKALNFAGRPFR